MAKSKIEQLYAKPVKQKKGDKSDDSLLCTARKRARDGATYWKENWEAAEDDLKFLAGEQWPSQVRTERELEQRPCLVNNVLPTFVDQVLGDQRQNRPAIKVSATDVVRVPDSETGEDTTLRISNTTGKTDYELAEVFTGLIKNIEYNCDAETSYDIAFQSAVESGMGYLRVRSDYLTDETFEQDLIIDHIENQFAVTMDPNAKERDRSDMNWCLIDDTMEKEAFKEHYPDANADPVNSDSVDDMGTWYSDNSVKISEYFTREPCVKEVALLSDGRSVYMDELEPVVDELLAKGVSIVRTRKVKTYKVFWRKITGLDVIEGPVELPCSTIPVVPVWGKALVIKKKIIFRSIIRHSKDAQRMANYWDSAATEAVALAPKAPFIAQEGHVEGYEHQWETANTVNRSVLTYVPQSPGDPGPRRQQPASVPAAEITLGMNSSEKIKATLGMYDASLGAMGNETSGRAIVARQRQGDRGSFAFIDNLTKAIRRVGKIMVEMIPKIYDTERVVRLKFSDETEDFVKLNEQILDEQTNEWVTINDLNVAKYDVVVTTGPAYSTQRQEAAESLIQFAQAVPASAAVIADLIAQNMDFPGADVMAERLKKIVPPNVLTNDEREKLAEDMPDQDQPTPEQQLQMAELEVKGQEVEADMAKAQTELVKAQLQSAEAQAKLQAIESGQGQAYQQVRELVAEALAELMANNQNVKA
ncbi:putative portal protein [Vibrio phage 66E30.1]|nr:putative portal protein [Vibrio phage 41E34.2]QZI91231.1 hypothetical protein PODOV053v2_p0003 [Vibrio phage 24E30.2]QZI91271.1 hypothetical protein PODOV052v2_p0003 [Vibrio phage 24E35.2]QZI91434.1 hypothetical protein PODOV048v2_p0003 [Vibrio phage 34E29.1]QZI91471.1 portal protein [Vibrio phage 36E38.1]QZI91740.1 portal protein [Vibrio phage 44E38.1]QZI91777.1 hypothetical protein PODOV046v2_p0003 [Vibrio phage 44E38.2]QZI91967.1 hypothetical protein PODOV051v2_p0003 [Vibrio phage 64E3